jgi:hypothetical protein
MVRYETLLAALAVSAPTLWDAFATGNTPVDTALFRFLLAVPVCAVGLLLLRKVFEVYAVERPAVAAATQALDETRDVFARRREDSTRADAGATQREP